jgi:hypothetical protein
MVIGDAQALDGGRHSRVPHSFAFFANEWASVDKTDARAVPRTERRNRTTLISIRHS